MSFVCCWSIIHHESRCHSIGILPFWFYGIITKIPNFYFGWSNSNGNENKPTYTKSWKSGVLDRHSISPTFTQQKPTHWNWYSQTPNGKHGRHVENKNKWINCKESLFAIDFMFPIIKWFIHLMSLNFRNLLLVSSFSFIQFISSIQSQWRIWDRMRKKRV